MYEDSVGIQMILNGPDIPVGVTDTLVSFRDIAATVEVAMSGIDLPSVEDWREHDLVR